MTLQNLDLNRHHHHHSVSSYSFLLILKGFLTLLLIMLLLPSHHHQSLNHRRPYQSLIIAPPQVLTLKQKVLFISTYLVSLSLLPLLVSFLSSFNSKVSCFTSSLPLTFLHHQVVCRHCHTNVKSLQVLRYELCYHPNRNTSYETFPH